jgi:hypothetical protein
VNLVSLNHCYIEDIEVVTVGTGLVNAGTITLVTGLAGAGTTVGSIATGNNLAYWAHHYVPTGKTCNVTGVNFGSSSSIAGGGSIFQLRAIALNVANSVDKPITEQLTLYGQSSMVSRTYPTALKVVGPARVTMYVTTSSSTSINYRANFDFYDI